MSSKVKTDKEKIIDEVSKYVNEWAEYKNKVSKKEDLYRNGYKQACSDIFKKIEELLTSLQSEGGHENKNDSKRWVQ